MTAELVRGQNHPLSDTRLEIRVSAGHPVVACATCSDGQGTVREEWIAHPGAPTVPGVVVPRGATEAPRFTIDLDAVPEAAQQVNVLLALPEGMGGPAHFGATAAPFLAVTGGGDVEVARFTITGLDTETALVAVELYRRQGAWKVRAVGQGYAGGLVQLLADQGLATALEKAADIQGAAGGRRAPRAEPAQLRTSAADSAYAAPDLPRSEQTPAPGPDATLPDGLTGPGRQPASTGPQQTPTPDAPQTPGGPINYAHPRRQSVAPPPPPPAAAPARPGEPAAPVAGDATGWSMEERLYNQIWGMFEDLARSVAAYRSAVDFAETRMDQELDQVLSDPRSRIGGTGDAAREAARAKCEQLTDQARQALDRDLAQLGAESDVVEPALPPAFARWDNPAWHAYRVPMEVPMALRLGDLQLPESPELRIPLLVRLPLERGLWVDSGRTGSEAAMTLDEAQLRRLAMDSAVAHAARLLAVYPPGDFTVHVIDPAGAAAASLAPLVDSGVLAGPPAAGAQGVSATLATLTQRVDLVTMAVRGGAADALPPDLDTAEQLLIVNDFPHGFDDRAVTQLRYLADEGPAVGVHLLMVADREDASAYGPVLDPLWRSLLRITPVPDDHLADPWVRHAWTYEPLTVPPGSDVLRQVLGKVSAARREWGR
ncbi:TerD domain-containing protein [Streptomyces sp. SLBN-118]|uniref:TerD family protein n=1 Tax=Streptomyces sp. SLBN-118 TaxID=2768454 RepID=UPI00115467B6|nr:TerD family protein [Streptomyces sp. SLBN-118]TQK43791.1 TerD domain-containing protein [Streptomyces sp. SLBN-118]